MTCSKIDDFDMEITTNYDAFGNVVREEMQWVPRADEPIILSPPGTCAGEVSFEYRFDGLEPVAGDNLPHVTAWSYDPRQGCGLSQDPMGFAAGDSNLYRYVNNAPTNATDPSGLLPAPIDESGKFVGGNTTFKGYWLDGRISVNTKDNKTGLGILFEPEYAPGKKLGTAGPVTMATNQVANAQLSLLYGLSVVIQAEITDKTQLKNYYWRQYATMTGNSSIEKIRTDFTRPRGLDPPGEKKYPGEQYKGENIVWIDDTPALPTDITRGKGIPKSVQQVNGEKTTITQLKDATVAKLRKDAPNAWGMSKTSVKYVFETQLIYDTNGKEEIKGAWSWQFTLQFKDMGGGQFAFDPILDNKVQWK